MCTALVAPYSVHDALVHAHRGVKLFLGGLSWNTTEGKRLSSSKTVEVDAYLVLTDWS